MLRGVQYNGPSYGRRYGSQTLKIVGRVVLPLLVLWFSISENAIADGTRAGKHAFTLIPIRPAQEVGYPAGSLVDVISINDRGDILAVFTDELDTPFAYLRKAPDIHADARWNDAQWIRISDKNNVATLGHDLNNAGVVGGGIDSNGVIRGYEWSPDRALQSHFPDSTGEVHGVNNAGDRIGWTAGGPVRSVALAAGAMGEWTTLEDPPGWTSRGAFAISGRARSGADLVLHIAGIADSPDPSTPIRKIVVWRFVNGVGAWAQLPGGVPARANRGPWVTGINSQGVAGGWFETDAGVRRTKAWVPTAPGALSWTSYTWLGDNGADSIGLDLNERGEVLSENGLWIWNGRYGRPSGDPPFVWVPVRNHVNTPLGSNAASLKLRAINEQRTMVGVMSLDGSGNEADTIVVIYPHDTDNDGIADYREIVAGVEADQNGDWVIDDAEDFRSGVYAVPTYAMSQLAGVDHIQILRKHIDQHDLQSWVSNPDGCMTVRSLLADYQSDQSQQREIVIMLRTRFQDGAKDYLPSEAEQELIATNVETVMAWGGDLLDYLQIGNEVHSGPGLWLFQSDDGLSCIRRDTPVDEIDDEACLVEAHDAMFAYYERLAEAARKGSVAGGHRPIRIVAPAPVALNMIEGNRGVIGAGGTLSEESKQAVWIWRTVLYANQVCDFTDVHLHFSGFNKFIDAANLIAHEGVGGTGPPWTRANPPAVPEQLVCTEWGAMPATSPDGVEVTWWASVGEQLTALFYDDDPANDPAPSWDHWIEDWRTTDRIPSPDFHMTEALDHLDGLDPKGFVFACYGGYHQTGSRQPPSNKFQLAAIEINYTRAYRQGEAFFSVLKDAYEAAVVDPRESQLIPDFTPHPDPDPNCR